MTMMATFWRVLSGTRPLYPANSVQFNLAVGEEALYLANRLKKETPEFNAAVLAETALILDIGPAVAELKKAA